MIFLKPISRTRVPGIPASFSQSKADSFLFASSLPLTTVNEVANPRCVTGIPVYAGAAIADVIPGITSALIPDSKITIQDLRGDGDHYSAHVISEQFKCAVFSILM